ncbi:MAG: pyridoxal 5'-phosphate synthase glutaminase subunit PdxT [Terriglobales bacterium]
MAVIGILALQGDFEAHARALLRLGVRPLRPADELPRPPVSLRPPAPGGGDRYLFVRDAGELSRADALILPGGESTTMLKFLEDEEFWRALGEFVRHKPAFGTCAGAILLAREAGPPAQRSLGVLDAAARRNAYGRQRESSIRCGSWGVNGSSELEMVFIRAPILDAIGPGVEVLARAGGAPVLVRQGRVLAATFHPELTGDLRVHEMFLAMAHAAVAEAGRGGSGKVASS